MKIERFEDLIAWQEARKLTNMTYDATDLSTFDKDIDLKRHLRRTSVSIMANIAEGFGKYSAKDSKKFYTDSRGSITELQSHLYVALDIKYITKELFDAIYNQTVQVNKLVNGLINSSLKLIKLNNS
ncbi:MAG: four helix bundle protein [Planctomycetota bacterium]